ncbi:hypothetical protein AMECASPLE_005455 [Ameca splendens]|uniref:Uncharacterized protein n=1 Tax=Ameca splendens TaxID=208324 RepID=A0ABV0XN63_9TELE
MGPILSSLRYATPHSSRVLECGMMGLVGMGGAVPHPSAILAPILHLNFNTLEIIRALGVEVVGDSALNKQWVTPQLQPQFYCTLDIHIHIHHNRSHFPQGLGLWGWPGGL